MGTATSVKLDEGQKRDLELLAAAGDRSVHYLLRKAVDEFIVREKARRALLADSLAADEEYERTGDGMTIAQVRKHMKKLERMAAK